MNKENTTVEHAARSTGQILETMASSTAQLITPPPPLGSSKSREKPEARAWLDKWLRIQAYHPQLEALEDCIYDFCAGYAKGPSRGQRVVLYGENGCGKTHAARAVFAWARRIAMRIPLVIGPDGSCSLAVAMFYNWPAVVDGFKRGEWEAIENMVDDSLLILDDIGAEHDPSRIGVEKLYYLLERRAHRWTILTTNAPPEAWESKFERRIASRFLRNCTHVDLSEVPDFNSR